MWPPSTFAQRLQQHLAAEKMPAKSQAAVAGAVNQCTIPTWLCVPLGLTAFQVDYLHRFQGGKVALWTHNSHIHFLSIYLNVRVVEQGSYVVQQEKAL